MYAKRFRHQILIRLEKDELVHAALLQFCAENAIQGGWVSGLGGLQWAEIGFYELALKRYHFERYNELLELTNLTGNVALGPDGLMAHLHVTVADQNLHVYGGHLKEAQAAGTVELWLTPFTEPLARGEKDPQIGLNLLDLTQQ